MDGTGGVAGTGPASRAVGAWAAANRTAHGAGAEIAYYSMEMAVNDRIPTFSGGLGVLAGDHLRAAADRGVPVVGVTLCYAHGFLRQAVDADGDQDEQPVRWAPAELMEELPERVTVPVAGRAVKVRPWRYVIEGATGHRVHLYFLDTDLDDNLPEDRAITDRLYMGDASRRLAQEAVLGLGGPLVLEALGHRSIRVHHMNEGHASLVPVGLLARRAATTRGAGRRRRRRKGGGWLAEGLSAARPDEVEGIRGGCVFTTHTPVPAGHDRFGTEVAAGVLGAGAIEALDRLGCLEPERTLNMTLLGMRLSRFVNGVSLRHREVTRRMFPGVPVEAVTNGVHTATWAAPSTATLFDRHLRGWRRDSALLRYAIGLPLDEVLAAHGEAKARLCEEVSRRTGVELRRHVLTVGIARRFAGYKRNDLILSDLGRLVEVAEAAGPLQLVYAGKAHPRDEPAKAMIRHVVECARSVGGGVRIVFLDDYGMELGRLLCAGSDVWLNTPAPPNEASGTSGMKAALNGVPSVSTLDGWWIEGRVEGVTGWTLGARHDGGDPGDGAVEDGGADPAREAGDLYDVLERAVAPLYYREPERLAAVGRHAMALTGSFFSAHRMVDEYARRAYEGARLARS